MLGGLVRYEWLVFEVAVVGWACWELWSLRRDRKRAERAKPRAGDADPPQHPGG